MKLCQACGNSYTHTQKCILIQVGPLKSHQVAYPLYDLGWDVRWAHCKSQAIQLAHSRVAASLSHRTEFITETDSFQDSFAVQPQPKISPHHHDTWPHVRQDVICLSSGR